MRKVADLTQDPRGTPAPARLHYTANRFARALNRAAENTALARGISLPQLIILEVLGEGMPLSNAQLARRTFVSSQATHVVATSMVELGLLEPAEHPTNRRVRLLKLSEEGWRVLDECDRELTEREQRLAELVGPDLGPTLNDVFQRAADVLAGGYFGDREAEAEAVARRQYTSKYMGRSARREPAEKRG